MTEVLKPDICILGAGSGGLTVAAVASQLGVDTVLIERDKMGGDCLNFGCVPTKALLAAAHAAESARAGQKYGIKAGPAEADGGAPYAYVQQAIDTIAPHDSVERFEGFGVRVLLAEAKFTSPKEVQAGDFRIQARRFVIATGSGPAVPPIPGLADTLYLTNETIFGLEAVPDHLIVIGGGPIGVELAQAHRQLGAKVTVLEMAGILANDDPELVSVVRDQLLADGIDLREEVKVTGAAASGDGVSVTVDGPDGAATIDGSHVLVAAGRRPNIGSLNLEAAGIAYEPSGIHVDARLRTSNKKIFAIGDCTGGHQFTHIAGYHAGIVIRNALFRMPAKVNTAAYPWVTYTSPELAHVGLNEDQARKTHGEVRIVRWPYAQNDRAVTEGKTEGLIKLVATPKGKVLGASIVGAQAGELIQIWGLAISAGLKLSKVAGMISPYPTLGEANKRAAGEFYKDSLFSPRTRGLIKFLRWFG